jgi:predicted acylesterase/phospholipase RssA
MDRQEFEDYAADDTEYFGAKKVVEEELKYIRRRRGLDEDAPIEHLTGLALSGGGIRSASFSLGVLQAMAYKGWLKKVDYLSTVSGGGYIGSSISWLLSRKLDESSTGIKRFGVKNKNFPYGTYPMSGKIPEILQTAKDNQAELETSAKETANVSERYKGKLLRYLRQQAKYLTPGDGINVMSLAAVVLRGALLSLFVYFGLLFLIFALIGRPVLDLTAADLYSSLPLKDLNLVIWLALAGSIFFALFALLYSLGTYWLSKLKRNSEADISHKKKGRAYRLRQFYERWAGRLLTLSLALLIFGAIPYIYNALQQWAENAAGITGVLSSIFGILSGITAFFKSSNSKKGLVPMGLIVTVGTAALWFGLLLLSYHLSILMPAPYSGKGIGLCLVIAAAVGVVGWYANINYVSIHRYYRDRLMEAFMPDVDKALDGEIATRAAGNADKQPIDSLLDDQATPGLDENPAPYHLINTNVVLESSRIPKFRGRGGDSFILSPRFCGSNATGWSRSEVFMNGRMTLPTAMAISGAAVNPSTGVGGKGITRQPLLSMLMGLLNIRLGYWAPNPNPKRAASSIPNYFLPGLSEMFTRWKLNEKASYVELTDGGHFENLALYELIRRRARLIIVCDAGADPKFQFSDFANVVEKARVDFGTLILSNCDDLKILVPHQKSSDKDDIKSAERGYIKSTIIYPDNSRGCLLYIKTTFFEKLSADLYGYKMAHPQFPDEPTSDQFFDEKQFEAYRELGYQTAWHMMNDKAICDDELLKHICGAS